MVSRSLWARAKAAVHGIDIVPALTKTKAAPVKTALAKATTTTTAAARDERGVGAGGRGGGAVAAKTSSRKIADRSSKQGAKRRRTR